MILLSVAVLLLVVILYGSHVYLLDKRYRMPPGPAPIPYLGNLHIVGSDIRKPLWRLMRKLAAKYGPVMTFYIGHLRMVILSDAKIIQETLVGQSDVFSWRLDLETPGFRSVPPGLVYANDPEWRQRRRFSMQAMRHFGMGKEAMVTKVQDEVAHLLPEIESYNSKPFNPKRLVNNAVSNIICSLVFGKRFHYNDSEFHELLHVIDVTLSMTVKDNLPWLVLPLVQYFKDSKQRKVDQMTKHAITEHRKDFNPEDIRDFPDFYLQHENQKEGLDPEALSLVMTDLFIAGTETTSNAIAWTLLYLATYPEIQQKCQDVIDSVLGSSGRLPTIQDRPNLVYIDAFMCEILRHVNIIPMSLFHANLDRAAKIEGYDIPPNTYVLYNVALLHYDSAYWKDPKEFRPERWINPADGKLLSHSTHFMPFGLGPRVCLGEALARVEYFIIVVSLLHRFRFVLKETVDFKTGNTGVVFSPPDFEITANLRLV